MIGSFSWGHFFYLVQSIWWTLVLSGLAFILGPSFLALVRVTGLIAAMQA